MKSEWLRYCGTVGKPDGNREDKYQPEALRESGLLTEGGNPSDGSDHHKILIPEDKFAK